MKGSAVVTIYVLSRNQYEDQVLVQCSKNGLTFVQGRVKAIDPSPIFAAARIFIKKVFNSIDATDWDCLLYRTWLAKFVESELVRHENGNFSFFIEIPSELLTITNEKSKFLNLSDLRSTYSDLNDEFEKITNEIQEIRDYYATTERAKNNFALFNCEPDPLWVLIYEALYQGHFKNKGEIWKTYNIVENEFPTDKELEDIRGIVISGSEWSVYDPSLEVVPIFLERLRHLVRTFPEIKIIGVCFGCQSLATAFGGRVGRMNLGNRPMLLNREKVQFMNGFHEKFVQKLKIPEAKSDLDCLYIVECHGDNVEVLPEGATLYGTSDRTPVEIFGIGNNILAFQGHPEFNASLMLDKILPEEKDNWEHYDDIFDASSKSFAAGGIDLELMSHICQEFLRAEE